MPETRHASVGPFHLPEGIAASHDNPVAATLCATAAVTKRRPAAGRRRLALRRTLASVSRRPMGHRVRRWLLACRRARGVPSAWLGRRSRGADAIPPRPMGANRAGALTAAADRAVWMDAVACQGTEAKLADCAFGGWGRENCQHAEDVAVRCNATGAPTTTPTAPWTPMPVGVDEGHGAPAAATQSPCQPRGAGGATIDIAPCVMRVLEGCPGAPLPPLGRAPGRRLRRRTQAEDEPSHRPTRREWTGWSTGTTRSVRYLWVSRRILCLPHTSLAARGAAREGRWRRTNTIATPMEGVTTYLLVMVESTRSCRPSARALRSFLRSLVV